MRLVLAWHLNHRLITLGQETRGEVVGVLRRTGEYRYVRWLGFVGVQRARELGRPVRLRVSRVGRHTDRGVDWTDVPEGKHVQGCMTPDGVYAVMEPMIRLV